MLYIAIISFTDLNYALITLGSSYSIIYLFLAELKAILSLDKHVTKRLGEFLPTSILLRSLSSFLAILATLER
jgi:hypothetical protein